MEHPVTEDMFISWTQDPVTKKFFKRLVAEREEMKEGLINAIYEHEDLVKGRCQAIALMLDVTYEGLFNEQ